MNGGAAFFAVLLSWVAAQLAKLIIAKVKGGGFLSGRALKTGGMPSAHAALVSSLAFSAGSLHGVESVEFLTALVLAVIVCYDAMGMRKEFHRQSRLLKEIAGKLAEEGKLATEFAELGDFEGHEAAEVVVGLVIGIVIPALILNL